MYKLLFLVIWFVNCSLISNTESTLTIEISAISADKKGFLRIGVFKKEGYPDADKTAFGRIVPVTGDKMHVTFAKCQAGIYAVAVIHDEDKNGKLTKNSFGIPTESYGFSKNKYGLVGPPNFSDISFKLESGKKVVIPIRLK